MSRRTAAIRLENVTGKDKKRNQGRHHVSNPVHTALDKAYHAKCIEDSLVRRRPLRQSRTPQFAAGRKPSPRMLSAISPARSAFGSFSGHGAKSCFDYSQSYQRAGLLSCVRKFSRRRLLAAPPRLAPSRSLVAFQTSRGSGPDSRFTPNFRRAEAADWLAPSRVTAPASTTPRWAVLQWWSVFAEGSWHAPSSVSDDSGHRTRELLDHGGTSIGKLSTATTPSIPGVVCSPAPSLVPSSKRILHASATEPPRARQRGRLEIADFPGKQPSVEVVDEQ